MTERHSPEQGRLSGEEMANIILRGEAANPPRAGVTRRQFEMATESMFRGTKEEVESLRADGVSESDLALFVQAVLDGFRERGASSARLVKCAKIADAAWLKRLVPSAGAEEGAAVSKIPEGLSRLQRERYEKKARKGTLRAV